MPGIDVVLFDLDNTLSDFGWSQREAFAGLLAEFDVDDPGHYLDTFTRLASPLWDRLERGELTLETLNQERFELLVANTDIDVDPARLAPRYLEWLSRSGGLIDGATEVLDALHGEVRLGLITNGYSEVQRPRLASFDLGRYFDAVVVSSEIGHAKPGRSFFDVAFSLFDHPEPESVLVVGDSLSSDIAGGAQYGARTCWFNPDGQPVPPTPPIDHVVASLGEIPPIVL